MSKLPLKRPRPWAGYQHENLVLVCATHANREDFLPDFTADMSPRIDGGFHIQYHRPPSRLELISPRPAKQLKTQAPPGAHLYSFASAVFSAKSLKNVIEPTLLDMRDEYSEALKDDHPRKAQRIRLRGYLSFWSAVLAQILDSLTKLVVTVWKGIQ